MIKLVLELLHILRLGFQSNLPVVIDEWEEIIHGNPGVRLRVREAQLYNEAPRARAFAVEKIQLNLYDSVSIRFWS